MINIVTDVFSAFKVFFYVFRRREIEASQFKQRKKIRTEPNMGMIQLIERSSTIIPLQLGYTFTLEMCALFSCCLSLSSSSPPLSLSLSACQSTVCWCILYAIFSCLFAFISTAKRRSLQFYSLSKSEKYVLKIESVVFYLVVCSQMHSQSVSRAPHAASNRITLPYACVH